MSLPTRGIVYDKTGKQIGTIFYNVGWVWDALKVLTDVKQMFADLDKANKIVLYGYTYQRDTIDAEIAQTEKAEEEHREKLRQRAEERRKQSSPASSGMSSVMVDVVRRAMPKLIAEQIAGVQPMADKHKAAFSHPIKMRLKEDIDDTQHFVLD